MAECPARTPRSSHLVCFVMCDSFFPYQSPITKTQITKPPYAYIHCASQTDTNVSILQTQTLSEFAAIWCIRRCSVGRRLARRVRSGEQSRSRDQCLLLRRTEYLQPHDRHANANYRSEEHTSE